MLKKITFISAVAIIATSLWLGAIVLFFDEVFAEPDFDVETTLVRVDVTKLKGDLLKPWQPVRMQRNRGTGVVLDTGQILTAAHVVSGATEILLTPHGTTRQFAAKVAFISEQIDLATLEVEDASFFDYISKISLIDFPDVWYFKATAYGYPYDNGPVQEISSSIVSIQNKKYSCGGSYPDIELSNTNKPGFSGGPLIHDGKLIGINRGSSEENGYAISISTIRQFLKDISDGRIDGVPSLAVMAQPVLNPAVKKNLGIPETYTGVVVSRLLNGHPPQGLAINDLIRSINGYDVSDSGHIGLTLRAQVPHQYVYQMMQVGERVKLGLVRDGKPIEVEFTLLQDPMNECTSAHERTRPRYFIYGGLVFTPFTERLSRKIVKEYEGDPLDFCCNTFLKEMSVDIDEVIILIGVLEHARLNGGYSDRYAYQSIESVNGTRFRSMIDLIDIVSKTTDDLIVFETYKGEKIVIDRRLAEQEAESLLKRYRVESDRSVHYRE